MKNRHLLLSAALSALAIAGSTATAGTISLAPGSFQTGNGGEFTATPVGVNVQVGLFSDTAGTFQTFCVENQQTFSGYNTPFNAAVNAFADPGNSGTPNLDPTPDYICSQTAWVYTQFRTGGLSGVGTGYRYGGTQAQRREDARALQILFWLLEDELPDGNNNNVRAGGAVNPGGWLSAGDQAFALAFLNGSADGNDLNAYQKALAIAMFNAAIAATDGNGVGDDAAFINNGIGNVRVVNLTDGSGNRQQDQLVMVPVAVPLPPAAYAGLGTLSLAGVGAFIRRRNLNKVS